MKKINRKLVLNVGVIAVSLVIVFVFLGNNFGFWSQNNQTSLKLVDQQTNLIKNITEIKILGNGYHVNVKPTKGAKIELKHLSTKKQTHKKIEFIQVSNELTIKMPKQNNWFFGIFNQDRNEVEILIPEDFEENLFFEIGSGELKASHLNLNQLDVQLASGYVELTGIKTNKMVNAISSGELKAEDISANFFKSRLKSGKISFQGKVTSLDLAVLSGKIDIGTTRLPNDLTMKVTSGKIDVTLPKNDGFDLDYNISSGKIDNFFSKQTLTKKGLDHYKTNGPRYQAKISSGKINLKEK